MVVLTVAIVLLAIFAVLVVLAESRVSLSAQERKSKDSTSCSRVFTRPSGRILPREKLGIEVKAAAAKTLLTKTIPHIRLKP